MNDENNNSVNNTMNDNNNCNHNGNNNSINNDNNNNDTNVRPKRLSAIKAMDSITSTNNTYKRKSNNNINNNALTSINNSNNDITELTAKKIKSHNHININPILLNINNVLIPVILAECFSYLELKELNLTINRVNKYWASHTYNNITLGYRRVELTTQYKLLCGYINNTNADMNNNNQAVNLLIQLKYASDIRFFSVSPAELFPTILKHTKNMENLRIWFNEEFNYLAINDASSDNVRLDKVESIDIICRCNSLQVVGEVCDHLLRKLSKCVDLDKVTDMSLRDIPIAAKPLQVFENNPFTSLTDLFISYKPIEGLNDSFKYLAGLTQLIKLELDSWPIANNSSPISVVVNWMWLSKLMNLEDFSLGGNNSNVISNPTDFLESLASLPKLQYLHIPFNLTMLELMGHLSSNFRVLQSFTFMINPDDSFTPNYSQTKDIKFPTIPTLSTVSMRLGYANFIIPILISNPQIKSITFSKCEIEAEVMAEILEAAPSLQVFDLLDNSTIEMFFSIDPIIPCCEFYPEPVIALCSDYSTQTKFLNPINKSRQELIHRLKQHLTPRFKCSNPKCVTNEYSEDEEEQEEEEEEVVEEES